MQRNANWSVALHPKKRLRRRLITSRQNWPISFNEPHLKHFTDKQFFTRVWIWPSLNSQSFFTTILTQKITLYDQLSLHEKKKHFYQHISTIVTWKNLYHTHIVSIHKVGLYHRKAAFNSHSYFDQVIKEKLHTDIPDKKKKTQRYNVIRTNSWNLQHTTSNS